MTKQLAVGYCRVSSNQQVNQGNWIDWQNTNLVMYAKQHNINLIQVFNDEWVSWWLFERAGILALFSFVDAYNKTNSDKITILLTDDIDRIARDPFVHYQLKLEMKKRQLKLVTQKMEFEDTAVGKFTEGMLAINAAFFRDQNTERVVSRQRARLLDGYWIWKAPTGYKFAKDKKWGKILQKVEPDASIIQSALLKFANGSLNTLKDVGDFFNEKGLIIKWNRISSTGKTHTSTVSRILKNMIYSGHYTYEKQALNKKTGKVWTEWNIPLTKGKHKGIISLDTFYKIQKRLNAKTSKPVVYSTSNTEDFPLRWLLVCEANQENLQWCFSSGNSGKSKYPYYRFNNKSEWKWKSVRAEKVHHSFEQLLEKCTLPESLIASLKEILEQKLGINSLSHDELRNQSKQQLEVIQEELDRTLSMAMAVSDVELMQKLQEKIKLLRERKVMIEAKASKTPEIKEELQINEALDLISNPKTLRKKASLSQKRTFIHLMFGNKILCTRYWEVFTNNSNTSLYHLFQRFSSDNLLMVEHKRKLASFLDENRDDILSQLKELNTLSQEVQESHNIHRSNSKCDL